MGFKVVVSVNDAGVSTSDLTDHPILYMERVLRNPSELERCPLELYELSPY